MRDFDYKKSLGQNFLKDQNLKYAIGVDYKNCTGCGLCSKVCPGKKGNKAITMKDNKEVATKSNIIGFLLAESAVKHLPNC